MWLCSERRGPQSYPGALAGILTALATAAWGPGQTQHINNASQCKTDSVFLLRGAYFSFSWREKHDPSLSPDHLPSLVWHQGGPTRGRVCLCPVGLIDASAFAPAFASAWSTPISPDSIRYENTCYGVRVMGSNPDLMTYYLYVLEKVSRLLWAFLFLDLCNGNYIGPPYFIRKWWFSQYLAHDKYSITFHYY